MRQLQTIRPYGTTDQDPSIEFTHPELHNYTISFLTLLGNTNSDKMGDCCLKGIRWKGEPAGQEMKLAGKKCYKTGKSSSVAILVVHDLFGWTFSNTRILADHLADEVGATVYVPDL